MKENTSPPEQHKSSWIRFRTPGLITTELEQYGLMQWYPPDIPYGESIAMNTTRSDHWLRWLGTKRPVKIVLYYADESNTSSVRINTTSQNGEATALVTGTSRPKEPELFKLSSDMVAPEQTVKINFQGIADFIYHEDPFISHADFCHRYGQMVNHAFVSCIPPMMKQNALRMQYDDDSFRQELEIKEAFDYLNIMFIMGAFVGANGNIDKIFENALSVLTLSSLVFAALNAFGKLHAYKEYFEYVHTFDEYIPLKYIIPIRAISIGDISPILSHCPITLIKGAK